MSETITQQLLIVGFGAIALICASTIMNKSGKPGFGPNNIRIFGAIIILTFSGFLAVMGDKALLASTTLIGGVFGFLSGKLDKE